MNQQPVMPQRCATCPFRDEGWTKLRPFLEQRALSEAAPICHSTGSTALTKKIRRTQHLCRGARDFQIAFFHALGFISAPTDAAWAAKVEELEL